jgi:hypothetical protein
MTHPIFHQLRFARSEFVRSLNGVTEDEGLRRFAPINSLGWMVGHLAAQEQRYWHAWAQRPLTLPALTAYGFGQPASTPPLGEMWTAWRTIIATVDPILDALAPEDLLRPPLVNGRPHDETLGTMIRRVTYHYWFHNGEGQAIRQLLGHTNLPYFVGDIQEEAPYIPELAALTR